MEPFAILSIVAIFTIIKLWEEARCPTNKQWFKNM
jgi:hypothetical protein